MKRMIMPVGFIAMTTVGYGIYYYTYFNIVKTKNIDLYKYI